MDFRELFQIGVRNPQGMYLSPYDNEIYISNHGARGGELVWESSQNQEIMAGSYWVGAASTMTVLKLVQNGNKVY